MSDISSEVAGRMVKVTIKYGKGYEEPWFSFQGLPHEVRADIAATFEIEGADKISLAQLTLDAAAAACDMKPTSAKVEATTTRKTRAKKATEPKADDPKADDPKADDPKADEPKADEPKADEPKADEPKAEPAPELDADEAQAVENLKDAGLVKDDDGPPWSTDDDKATDDPWAAAAASQDEPAEEEKPHRELYEAIDIAADVDALKRLWADNQQAFGDDAELLGVWKAKGKSLKAAA